MAAVTRTIVCPIEELADVEVTYNLMATETQLEEFSAKMGRHDTWRAVITGVNNWPEKYGEPFGADTPMVFFLWASRKGFARAAAEYLNDPN